MATAHIFNIQTTGCRLEIELPDRMTNTPVKPKSYIFVLDNSGSMAGPHIEAAKEALHQLIVALNNSGILLSQMRIITFNDTPKDCNIEALHTISGSGTTDFINILEYLQYTALQAAVDTIIMFFTDGKDQPSFNQVDRDVRLQKAIRDLTEHNSQLGCIVHVNSLGFSSQHNPVLLNSITHTGTIQGSFTYIPSAFQISSSIKGLLSTITGNHTMVILQNDSNNLTLDNIRTVDNKLVIHFMIPATWVDLSHLTVSVRHTALQKVLPVQLLLSKETPLQDLVEIWVNYSQAQLTEITQDLIQGKILQHTANEKVEHLRTTVQRLRERVQHFTGQGEKAKNRIERVRLIQLCESLATYLDTYYEQARNYRADGIVQIANLISLTYTNVSSQHIVRTMERRINNNQQQYSDDLVYCIERSQIIKPTIEGLRTVYAKKLAQINCCIISTCDFLSALEDGTCLGVALQVIRPETTIVEGALLRIQTVGPSFLTMESFDELLGRSNQSAAFYKSGVSDGKHTLIGGEARENINAVFPLYICPEHWTVAGRMMKWAVGYLATANYLGAARDQLGKIPALVLVKVIRQYQDQPTEFHTRLIQLVMETCLNLWRDAGIIEDIKKTYSTYCGNGAIRTKFHVVDNYVFMAQIAVLVWGRLLDPSVADFMLFQQYMIEEELRRTQPKDRQWFEWLQLNPLKQTIRKTIDQDWNFYYTNNMLHEPPVLPVFNWHDIQWSISAAQVEFHSIDENFTVIRKILGILCDIPLLINYNPLPLEPMQLVAIAVQNSMHHRSNERLKAFQDNTYIDFIAGGSTKAESWLLNLIKQDFEHMFEEVHQRYEHDYRDNIDAIRSYAIMACTDLDIIKKMVMAADIYIGRNVSQYWKCLVSEYWTLPMEKAQLCINCCNDKVKPWQPGKKTRYQFYLRYHEVVTPDQMDTLFKHCSTYTMGYFRDHRFATGYYDLIKK